MHIMNRATINCARLVHFDEDSCGSVVHQIDKVLEAPKTVRMHIYFNLNNQLSNVLFLELASTFAIK